MVSSRVCAEVYVSRLTDFLYGFTSNQKCMFYIIKLQNFEFATELPKSKHKFSVL